MRSGGWRVGVGIRQRFLRLVGLDLNLLLYYLLGYSGYSL